MIPRRAEVRLRRTAAAAEAARHRSRDLHTHLELSFIVVLAFPKASSSKPDSRALSVAASGEEESCAWRDGMRARATRQHAAEPWLRSGGSCGLQWSWHGAAATAGLESPGARLSETRHRNLCRLGLACAALSGDEDALRPSGGAEDGVGGASHIEDLSTRESSKGGLMSERS